MTRVLQPRRRWESVAAAALLLLVAYLAWQWTQSVGGPSAFREQFGPWAPMVSVPAHVALSATPSNLFFAFLAASTGASLLTPELVQRG